MDTGDQLHLKLRLRQHFLYFKEKKCDIVLLEVGLGGDMDATNIISAPLCAVFAPISIDHTNILGNTLEEIAMHKSG